MFQEKTEKRNPLILLTLILCGEMIFILPFVLARVFRPTILSVFEINNFQLGSAFAVYGVVAMASYFFGGILADRFKSNNLISVALVATGLGGILISTIPDFPTVLWVYGYWGMTTILLFWAAMIRATRLWGGDSFQGRAFGFLEGGRGTIAALIGTLGVTIFAFALPDESTADQSLINAAFQRVLGVSSVLVIMTGVASWFALRGIGNGKTKRDKITFTDVKSVLKIPTIWLQAIIIVCAYVGYKGTDNFSLYANEIMGYTDSDAARVGTLSLWMRPVAAILAGFLADRLGGLVMTGVSFLLMVISCGVFSLGVVLDTAVLLFFVVLITSSLGIYALRGLYFAIMEEGKIPIAFTGTAVGLMSVLGYTPDIFMGPIMGHLLDSNPGIVGHQHVFMVMTGFSALGCIAAFIFHRVSKKM